MIAADVSHSRDRARVTRHSERGLSPTGRQFLVIRSPSHHKPAERTRIGSRRSPRDLEPQRRDPPGITRRL